MLLTLFQEKKEKTRIIIATGIFANIFYLCFVIPFLSVNFTYSVYDISIIIFSFVISIITIRKIIVIHKASLKWYTYIIFYSLIQIFLIFVVIVYVILYEKNHSDNRLHESCIRTKLFYNLCEKNATILTILVILELFYINNNECEIIKFFKTIFE
ncbi:hypothetical protein LY90DRAFT_665119 [Neocallimastix californiae]|uniref:Uncharacterized protein n=1 Tax=Neocallimastix californiae TaxID=1754190 RepID=A0A1Y2F1U5_9FUNG|nr:hypothetical protein LY90DRAFT_665119 [Neocallimastix californiae]|eukprot:ORY77862.1 hypothetical protein LY90DRAFT_665119 [Neocallimastix californiae]